MNVDDVVLKSLINPLIINHTIVIVKPLRASSVRGSDGEVVAVRVGLSIDGSRRLYVKLVGQNSFGDGKVPERIPVHDLHSIHWERGNGRSRRRGRKWERK